MFTQILINSLIAGSVYALAAAGFSIIYSTNRFVHFAHGAVITLSAYIFYYFLAGVRLPLLLAAALAIAAAALIGLAMHVLVYAPLRRRGASSAVLLIASVGLMFFCNNLAQIIFGADVKILSIFSEAGGMEIAGGRLTFLELAMLAASAALLVGLWLFSRYGRLGKTMRAVADNPELAEICGIDSARIQRISFLIGSALAGAAAIFIALEYNIEPVMGVNLAIQGFTGAVIGGITSLPGAMLGAYLLGAAENFGIWFLPAGYKLGVAFVLLLLFLLVRPQGIFGLRKGARE